MPEDEHAPAAAADDRSSSGSSNAAADSHGHVVSARLEQLERAFGEQSARLRAIERQLGLVEDTTRAPRPLAPEGSSSGPNAPRAGETTTGAAPTDVNKLHPGTSRTRDTAPGHPAPDNPATANAPFVSQWRIESEPGRERGANAHQPAPDAGTRETEASTVPPVRRDLEQLIGGSLFNWLGIIAVSLTVGFFLKYAFDNDWIGQRGQVLLGAVAGVGILGAAERLRARGYNAYAYVLSGGGIGSRR